MKYLYLIISIVFIGCSDKAATVAPQKEAVTQEATATQSKVAPVYAAPDPVIIPEVVETQSVVMEETVVLEADPMIETQAVVSPIQSTSNAVVVQEEKVTKSIKSDVPGSCAEWSDGCNICTRLSGSNATCTNNPCTNRVVSCLRWN